MTDTTDNYHPDARVNASELARRLGCSRQTVSHHIKAGNLVLDPDGMVLLSAALAALDNNTDLARRQRKPVQAVPVTEPPDHLDVVLLTAAVENRMQDAAAAATWRLCERLAAAAVRLVENHAPQRIRAAHASGALAKLADRAAHRAGLYDLENAPPPPTGTAE